MMILRLLTPGFLIHCCFQSPGGIVSKDSLKNKKRVVKLVTIVTVMFSLSLLPIQLILLLKSLELYKVTIFNISVQVKKNDLGTYSVFEIVNDSKR